MHQRIGLLTIIVLLFSSFAASAQVQPGIIKGFVYDKRTGEPMIYTSVFIKDTKLGVQTDINGYFSINLPPGSYTIFTTSVGYDTASATVSLLPEQIVTKKFFLDQREMELKGVEISARKTEKLTKINTGVTTITPRDLKLLPSTGGEPDLAQFLQVVPGVVFTGDQGGQLYIRGGSPAQTGILLDGVTIYNPFHSIGLFSVFETEAIRSVDVYSAGFSAEYGNRTSAIVNIHTKDGNKNDMAGIVSVSPLMARVMLEGPLVKSKNFDGSGITYLLSAKHCYLNSTSTDIYGGLGEPFKSGLPYSFNDLYGKITFSADNGSKLNLFAFNFDDDARLLNPQTHAEQADFKWNAKGLGATFVVTPGSSAALIDGKFAYSRYNIDFNELSRTKPRTTGIDGFEAGINFTYYLPGYSELKYGLEVSGFHTDFSYYNSLNTTTVLDRQSTLASLFVMYRKNIGGKLILEPSIRLQYYSALTTVSPEPRMGIKYNITENVRLKAAAGYYTQNIISTKSDRDIVNFFTGFLLSPDQQILNTNHQNVETNLQTSYHILGGVEVDVNKVEFNLEPWLKMFPQLIEINRNKIYASDPDFIAGDGQAYGIDLSAKYAEKRLYLWSVFSYQFVQYTNFGSDGNVQKYPPPFDRRININLLGSYTAGKKYDWEISIRYNMGSPFPFTQTQGFYENLDMTANGIQTNPLTQNGRLSVIYANDINGGRLSFYHRVDISVKKRFTLSKTSKLDATLSATNMTNRNNIFYVDRIYNAYIYQLPIFPSLNLTWNF